MFYQVTAQTVHLTEVKGDFCLLVHSKHSMLHVIRSLIMVCKCVTLTMLTPLCERPDFFVFMDTHKKPFGRLSDHAGTP